LEESCFSSLRLFLFFLCFVILHGVLVLISKVGDGMCFHDFLLLCDEDDVEWPDGGRGLNGGNG